MNNEKTFEQKGFFGLKEAVALVAIFVLGPIWLDWIACGVTSRRLYIAKAEAQIREYEAMKPSGGIILKLDDLIGEAKAEHRKVEYIEEHKYP